MEAIRVLLVDDHAVVRAGLKALLESEPELAVVGEACTGEEGVERAAELRPDVVVMDLSMPGCGGLEATRRITATGAGPRVVVLTVHEESDSLLPVLEAGGTGYVSKQGADGELVDAIRAVARGDVFLDPGAARILIRSCFTPRADDPVEALSPREREVLTLTAGGFNSGEIGERLHISPKTVDTYRQRVMEKLHLHHRSELVRFALREGLLAAAE